MTGNAPFMGCADATLKYYPIGPLLYASELELPELLRQLPQDKRPEPESQVMILLGRAPQHLEAAAASSPSCEANEKEFLLRLPGVATYYVQGGSRVTVDPARGATELDIRAYLMGNIFAVLCHQRGLLPLHASAIGTPRGAVAFLGASGAGKSSLVAFLSREGYTVLADDICLIDPDALPSRRVLPVAPWLKLWRTTLDALGEQSQGLPRTFSEDDKFRYPLPSSLAPTPLSEIVILERAGPGEKSVRFERLAPVHALHAVLELTYQSWLVSATGQTESLFLRCGHALDGVRVSRMHRPWGFERMGETIAGLEAQLSSV